MNFAPAPRKIPTCEIVAAVEGVTSRMNEQDANELRGSVCSILKRSKPPPSNITDEERVALSTLRKKENIIFFPAYD